MSEFTRREILKVISKFAAMLGLSGVVAKGIEEHGIAAIENPLKNNRGRWY